MGSEIWMVFLLLMPSLISCSACSLEERNSLLDFKQGINFTVFTEYQSEPLESWRGVNCCSWEGVGCHPRTAHVITLDLSHLYYEYGYSIPWSEVRGGLFQLLHLEHLDLSDNYFYPLSIPPQIGELRRLKYLSLYDCEFSGQIPRELTKLQNLEHLDLSDNALHGAIPREMGNISTLKFLDLSWYDGLQSNKLGEWITRLRGLEYLDLCSMNLTTEGDAWLGGYLPISPSFKLIPPFFANLSRLQQLDLWGNSFRGKIPTFLGPLPLSLLDLSGNSGLYDMEYLDLSSNKLNGSIPPTPGNLSKLVFLRREFKQIEWQHSVYSRESLSPE